MPLDYHAKVAWPPKPFNKAQDAMGAWDDWWVGDPDKLAARYRGGVDTRGSWDRAGGLTGITKSFFWGRPAPKNQQRVRLHLPLPADLTRTSADLLFGSAFTPVVGEGKSKTQDRLADLIGGDDTLVTLANGAEAQAALGGTYLRAVWDKGIADKPWITTVDADAAVPTFQWGRLVGVTFWQKLDDRGDKVIRFLERYEPGRIYYGLYEGTTGELGRPIPLTEHPASRGFADEVDETGGVDIPTQLLAAAYVPNVTPNPTWRTDRDLVHLGRSDFDQLAPWFDALDEVYTSLMRDVRLGKGRVFADATTMTPNGPGQGASLDLDQEVFTNAPGGGGSAKAGGSPLTPNQFAIRVQEHTDAIMNLIGVVIRRAGYSAASFGDDQISSLRMTATQVQARQDLSKLTRAKKIKHWQAALAHMARVLLEIDGAVFPGKGGGVTSDEITINFPSEANPDLATLAQTALALKNAGAASTESLVRTVRPNWTSDQVNDEVDLIKEEQQVGDPALFRPGIDDADQNAAPVSKEQADTLGTLVRSGATQDSAAQAAGIPGIKWTGERPVTTRPVDDGK
ncbi:phage portal protein [Cellulosimicrobium cellulans]|uniref:phage portal protein n=1 Tax=Cellulosimicrobium cellulans TaxID=1710 RepID=UPI0019654276|nr:phage portal protein [Cellulosimicrobium cellulans]